MLLLWQERKMIPRKLIAYLAIAAILAVTICRAVQAEPGRDLTIVNIPGIYGYSSAQTVEQAHKAIQLVRQTGVRLRLVAFMDYRADEYVAAQNLNTSGWIFYQLIKLARRNSWQRQGMVHFILPPMLDQGKRWIGGYSAGVCTNRNNRVSVSNATVVNAAGYSRVNYSAVVMAHELGHQIGASHNNQGINIMNACFPLDYVNSQQIPPWSVASVKQIKKCMRIK
jgi:hypothetical protein